MNNGDKKNTRKILESEITKSSLLFTVIDARLVLTRNCILKIPDRKK
jgi:hypothetical protein